MLISPRLEAEPAWAEDAIHIPAIIVKTTIASRPLDLTKRFSIGPPTVRSRASKYHFILTLMLLLDQRAEEPFRPQVSAASKGSPRALTPEGQPRITRGVSGSSPEVFRRATGAHGAALKAWP